MRVLTLANLKPGTGKTTSAVWLAHALHERGERVLLVDADPAASALEWSDLVDGFAFRIVGLPTKDVHRRIREFAHDGETVIIDAPQLEDRAGIARSCLRAVEAGESGSRIVVPVAPSPIEINRMSPLGEELEDLELNRYAVVLLNRVVTSAASGPAVREVLTDDGWRVLASQVSRREVFATSFGETIKASGTAFGDVADELLKES